MKRTLTSAALLLAMMLFAVSCTDTPTQNPDDSTSTDTSTSITERVPLELGVLARALADTCTFSEPLTQNDAYLKNHLYGFSAQADNMVACTAYVPAGITPEEVLVFEMKTADAANTIADMLRGYVTYQETQYGSYKPEEVPKLDDAVIVVDGTFVVYVVSTDNAAANKTVSDLLG
ncbi:MAG: DUF4358 domain-containing protein [Clostridia bacterium]|nr:DUF4358 domain-containing protein [Clostridia bacterium]